MAPSKRSSRGSSAQVQSPTYSKFDGGLNIRDFWTTIEDNELTVATNIRLDEGGVVRRRGGWTKFSATAVGTTGNLIGVHQGTYILAGTQTRLVVATDGVKVFYGTGAGWTEITGAVVNTVASTAIISFLEFNDSTIAYGMTSAPWTWDGSSSTISVLGGSPPIATIGIVWQNRVFFAGVTTVRTRLYYSDIGNAAVWGATAYVDIPSPYDGDEITGLAILYGNLIVFKRHSIYIVQGDAPENWVISKTNSAIGCVSPHSIVGVDNLVYFVSDKGLYAMNLSNSKQICYKVEPRYNTALTNQLSGSFTKNRILAVHYRFRNEIWMAVDTTAAGQDQHSQMEVHNYNVVDKNGDPAVSEHKMYGQIKITLDTNDYIDFTEDGGAEVSAQLTAGTYPLGVSSSESGTLCALIKTQMEAVNGASTYTVTYSVSTDKITITKNTGVFVIKFATGTNTAKNASGAMGFAATDTASAISATSGSTVAVRAAALLYQVCTAPAVMNDYVASGGNILPIASFYDKYVYLFSDTATTDAVSTGTAMAIPMQFFSGYRDFGDSDATKTLRNVWTSITFASGTPQIAIGTLADDLATETVGTLTPSSPSTFYNAKQSCGQIYGSSPQSKYFKWGFTSSDGGSLSFYDISFDIVWNGRRN